MKMKNRKGFTLVEVILVVLILGILAAIVVPRVNYSRNAARTEACNSNVSAINAMIEYAHVVDGEPYPTALTLGDFLANTTYFPDGTPACPWDPPAAYVLGANNRVVRHTAVDHP